MDDTIREKLYVDKKTSEMCQVWRIVCYILAGLCAVGGIVAGLTTEDAFLFFICCGTLPCLAGATCFRVLGLHAQKVEIDLALIRKTYWDIPEEKEDSLYL